MRFVPVLIALSCLALPASATKPTPDSPPTAPEDLELAGAPLVVQEHTYRFGDLLRSEPGTSVEACAAACHADARCVAWTLTPPAYSAEARCELKANPGTASYRPGAVSGMSESLRMEPQMRYQVKVPEGYQPAPAETEELLGAEAAAPITMPELLGTSETRISAVMKPAPAPVAEAPVEPVIAEAPPAPVKETLALKASAPTAPTVAPGPPPPVKATAFAQPAEPIVKVVAKPAAQKAPVILEPRRTALPPPAPSAKADAFAAEAAAEAGSDAGS